MADEITYMHEMSLPIHRPGMEKVVNRAVPDERDSDGNRMNEDRPTVQPGKADPFAVKGDSAPAKAAPAPAPKASSYSGFTGSERLQHVTDTVDDAAG